MSKLLSGRPDLDERFFRDQAGDFKNLLIFARVGGVVSETSFKFFVQFVGWTAVYCIFNLIVAAYFLEEYRRKVSKHFLLGLPIQTPRTLWEKATRPQP